MDAFFDFIVDAIPSKQPEKSPKEILDRLTDGNQKGKRIQPSKKLETIISENEDSPVTLSIVSTKYRSVRNIEIVPNKRWNGSADLLGLEMRLSKFDDVFNTYCPFADIKMNSPIKKAGIIEGEYLIGCKEF